MVAVVGIPDEVLGERGRAIVVARGEAPTLAQLKEFCEGKLADYKVPDVLEIRDSLPMTAMFKVDKRALLDESR